MIHILDASCINAAGRHSNAPFVLDVLDDLIKDRQACFPDEVLLELERLAKGEFTYSWLKATSNNRFNKGAAYKHHQYVAHQVPSLVDDDAQYESSAVAVLAQARDLSVTGLDVAVVTEDIRVKPTRTALSVACNQLGMPWMRLSDCLGACGFESLNLEPS